MATTTLKITAAAARHNVDKRGLRKVAVWRAAAELADLVRRHSGDLPAEDRDWLADPIRHAAASAVDHVAQAWAARQEAGQFAASLARAEADLAEVQTWALLALRHGHWSHGVADDLDRRCETILDQLIALSHLAGRWTTTVARRAA